MYSASSDAYQGEQHPMPQQPASQQPPPHAPGPGIPGAPPASFMKLPAGMAFEPAAGPTVGLGALSICWTAALSEGGCGMLP